MFLLCNLYWVMLYTAHHLNHVIFSQLLVAIMVLLGLVPLKNHKAIYFNYFRRLNKKSFSYLQIITKSGYIEKEKEVDIIRNLAQRTGQEHNETFWDTIKAKFYLLLTIVFYHNLFVFCKSTKTHLFSSLIQVWLIFNWLYSQSLTDTIKLRPIELGFFSATNTLSTESSQQPSFKYLLRAAWSILPRLISSFASSSFII